MFDEFQSFVVLLKDGRRFEFPAEEIADAFIQGCRLGGIEIHEGKRDPTILPTPGDIFKHGKRGNERHVSAVEIEPDGKVFVVWRDIRDTGDHGGFRTELDKWTAWCKKVKPEILPYEGMSHGTH